MFRAYAPDQDKLVAVKMFRLDLPPDRVHRLVDELRRLIDAKIAHPGIAAPLAAGITGISAYLAQEFVAGDSLDIVLREHGPAAAADAIRVAGQLAGALDYAAAAGIVHGALHPRDVLVSADDARLTGLGVARALERVGVAASIRRPYSSPERAGGGEWDRRADVFSLAALMHEMLWARRLNATGDQAAEGLSELPGASLPVLRQLFARALAERPDDRFETALAFADGLKQAFPGQPAESARGASGRRRTADPRRTAETLRVTPQVPRLPLDVSDASRAGDADATLPASPQPSEDDDTVPTGAPAPVDDDTVPTTPPALVDDDDTVPATPPAPIDDDDTVPTTPSGPPDDDGTVPTRTVLGADTDATVATGHQPAVDGETVPTVAPAPPSVGGDAGGPPQVPTARATTQGAPLPAVDATNAAGPAAPTGTDRRVSELLLGEAARVGREESPALPVVPVPAAVPPRSTAAMLVLALVCLTVGFVAGYRVASLQHANAPVEPAAAPPSAATGEARDESAERVATATPAGPNAALTGSPDGGAAPSGAVPVAEAAGAAPGGRGPVGAKEPPPAPASAGEKVPEGRMRVSFSLDYAPASLAFP